MTPRLTLALLAIGVGLGIASVSGSGSSARADEAGPAPGLLVSRANAAYAEAMESNDRDRRLAGFRRAERLYAAAIEEGIRNAELYANLGNAALQAERPGTAVLAYRRALTIAPGLERARQNLGHIRGQLPEWLPKPSEGGALDTFFFWHRTLSRDARADLASGFFFVAALLLAAAIARRNPLLRTAALVPLAGWLVLLGSLVLDPSRRAAQEAVVIAPEAIARAADSIHAPSRFGEPLPAGTEVTILEDRGGWLQIALQNGRSSWVQGSQIERIAP